MFCARDMAGRVYRVSLATGIVVVNLLSNVLILLRSLRLRRRCWGRSESWRKLGRSWLRSDSSSTSSCPANWGRTKADRRSGWGRALRWRDLLVTGRCQSSIGCFNSHKTKDNIALEAGLFGDKTSACARCISVRMWLCVCVYVFVSEWHWHSDFNMKKAVPISKLRKFKSYDKRIITLWVLLHHEHYWLLQSWIKEILYNPWMFSKVFEF